MAMRRQERLRSSSSRREGEASPTGNVRHAANSIGCMAGVFQLISSKYHTRRKFLTFGRKRDEKQTTSSSSSSPQEPMLNSPAEETQAENRHRFHGSNGKNGFKEDSGEFRKLSFEVQRSPTIPAEIRRSNSLHSPESFRSSVSSVVARLMGLDDEPVRVAAMTTSRATMSESTADKRRKLLGALEKCDEDLQELKRIIEAVRSADRSKTPAPVSIGRVGGVAAMRKCADQISGIPEQEQPSPVSVLEDFTESPPPSSTGGWYSSRRTRNDVRRVGRVTAQQQQMKTPGEDNIEIASFWLHNANRSHVLRTLFHQKSDRTATMSPLRSSRAAMAAAVHEVCMDVEIGQRREIERVGVVVEDFIYREVIEEMTKELMRGCHVNASFPFENCMRKLRF